MSTHELQRKNGQREKKEVVPATTENLTGEVDNSTNDGIALALHQVADLLETHAANPFRVRAYRAAATTVHQLDRPVADIFRTQGVEGLMALPSIGQSLAHSIAQLVQSGRLSLLQRLQGHDMAEQLFQTVPDIGPMLARRIHEQLGIETLAELQAAAIDGRLALVPGMGTKRLRAVRESLAGRFAQFERSSQRPKLAPSKSNPDVPVAELLDVDREYRELAKSGKVPRIAPRRFNPTAEAWLPVLHTERGKHHYTALYSNTLKAHEMGTTHDWVVIYRDDSSGNGHWTVITATFGQSMGRRVVRGLETECRAHYATLPRRETQPELFQ